MKVKLLNCCLFFSLFCGLTLFAQTDYYYYQGDKIELTIDQSKLKIILSDDYLDQRVTLPLIKSFNLDQLEIQDNDHSRLGTAELNGILSDKMFQETVEALRRLKEVDNIAYYYKRTSSSSIATSNIFYVKLMDKNDLKVLEKIALEKDVKIVHQNRFMPLWYRLELKKNIQKTALELSNEFFETGLFESVDPAFMFDFSPKCTNDGNFNDLWGLDNNTTPGIDINICNAWNISEGNGVTVAVLDQGVFVNHNDLDANISNLSYDTENGTSPSVFVAGNIHGTHVAGTIAAEKDNNLQIVGVAQNRKL